jgi:hypothetical protein
MIINVLFVFEFKTKNKINPINLKYQSLYFKKYICDGSKCLKITLVQSAFEM